MTWSAILWLLLSLANSILKWAETRKKIEASEAQSIARSLKESIDALGRIEKARNAAHRKFDDAGGLPDDNDPNLRD